MRVLYCVGAWFLVTAAAAQDFGAPLAEQLERMAVRIESAVEAGRPLDVLAALDYYRVTTLPERHIPASALLAEADAAEATGDPVRAVRALETYSAQFPGEAPERVAVAVRLPALQVQATAAIAAAEVALRADDLRRERAVQEHRPPPLVAQLIDDMVHIPAGVYLMGSQSRLRADTDEKPVHIVRVKAFRLGRYEVTYDQYDLFARMTGRSYPQDGGYGRGNHPVGNVSWEDAQAFIAWLNGITGLRFRLPSEAEWEYVARAGTKTDYPWGDTFEPGEANGPETGGRDQWAGPAPVGQFPANPFGVHDMIGNVWEWVQDCYRGDYVGAPFDGSADDRPDCTNRVFRGGSFYSFTKYMRTAYRGAEGGTSGNLTRGFRLAED